MYCKYSYVNEQNNIKKINKIVIIIYISQPYLKKQIPFDTFKIK